MERRGRGSLLARARGARPLAERQRRRRQRRRRATETKDEDEEEISSSVEQLAHRRAVAGVAGRGPGGAIAGVEAAAAVMYNKRM